VILPQKVPLKQVKFKVTAKALPRQGNINLVNMISKFSEQKAKIQLKEFVRQIKKFMEITNWKTMKMEKMRTFVSYSDDCLKDEQINFGD
jgi:hypothetical protein